MTQLSVPKPVVTLSGERPTHTHLDMLARIPLSGEETGGSLAIVEERARAGAGTPRHVHAREAEIIVVLEGELEGWAAGETRRVTEGGVLYLPPSVEHAFRVVSDLARFMVIVTPAGFEHFFERTGDPYEGSFLDAPPVPGPPPPPEAVDALAAILSPMGVELTGPPPF